MSWGHRDEFCPECQGTFHAQPLGALTRRWSADSADASGRMSGLICERCKSLVRKHHARVSNGECMFHFVNPNPPTRTQVAPIVHAERTAAFASISANEKEVRRGLHEQETGERLRWCLDRGLTPAHEHIHRAPGNDAKFMVVILPVQSDFIMCLQTFCGVLSVFIFSLLSSFTIFSFMGQCFYVCLESIYFSF